MSNHNCKYGLDQAPGSLEYWYWYLEKMPSLQLISEWSPTPWQRRTITTLTSTWRTSSVSGSPSCPPSACPGSTPTGFSSGVSQGGSSWRNSSGQTLPVSGRRWLSRREKYSETLRATDTGRAGETDRDLHFSPRVRQDGGEAGTVFTLVKDSTNQLQHSSNTTSLLGVSHFAVSYSLMAEIKV